MKTLAQHLSVLWALCHGNGQHATMVAEKTEFLHLWSRTIDACIATEDDPSLAVLASLCLGISATVFVNTPKRRGKMVDANAVVKIASLLRKFPQNALIVTQSLMMLDDFNRDPRLERTEEIMDTLKCALDNWQHHHQHDEHVTFTVVEKLPRFAKLYSSTFSQWNISDLVAESMQIHCKSSMVQIYGQAFLDAMEKADLKHRRGSVKGAPTLLLEQATVSLTNYKNQVPYVL